MHGFNNVTAMQHCVMFLILPMLLPDSAPIPP
jgi:hypothetical protein